MRQQINLFKPKPPPVEPPMSSKKIITIWVAACAMMCVISCGLWGLNTFKAHRLAIVAADAQRVKQKLSDLQAQLSVLQDVKSLQEQLKALGIQKEETSKRMDLLKAQGLDNRQGFSEKMANLAERNLAGMWFNKFSFLNGGSSIMFAGSALSPDLVPKFVDNVVKSKSYAKTTFESLMIELPKKDDQLAYVNFILQTTKGAQKPGKPGK